MGTNNGDSDAYAASQTEETQQTQATEQTTEEQTQETQETSTEVNQETQTEETQTEETQQTGSVAESSLSNDEQIAVLADNVNYIESLAKSNPALLEDEAYKSAKAALEEARSGSNNEQTKETQTEESNNTQETQEAETEEEETEEEETENSEDDPFGINKKGKKSKSSGVKLDFDVSDEMKGFMKDNYSIEDPSKFFESANKWRQQAQERNKFAEENDAIMNDLNNMPQQLRMGISLWANGKDFTEPFNQKQTLDFSKEFDKQEKEHILNTYHSSRVDSLKKELEEGAIDQEDFNKRLDDYYDMSKPLFKADQKQVETERANYERQIKAEEQAFDSSVDSSVENLKKNYPNFSESNVNDIKTMMVNGGVEELFYDKDGNFTKEAAEFVALAKFGKSYIKSMVNRAEKDGETKANLKKVQTGNKKPPVSKTTREIVDKKAAEGVNHLESVWKQDPY